MINVCARRNQGTDRKYEIWANNYGGGDTTMDIDRDRERGASKTVSLGKHNSDGE